MSLFTASTPKLFRNYPTFQGRSQGRYKRRPADWLVGAIIVLVLGMPALGLVAIAFSLGG